jgi:hypothetical protein
MHTMNQVTYLAYVNLTTLVKFEPFFRMLALLHVVIKGDRWSTGRQLQSWRSFHALSAALSIYLTDTSGLVSEKPFRRQASVV